ncbi:hypothetical protein NBRC116592_09080 [Colwellia sp. KU-HH00111]
MNLIITKMISAGNKMEKIKVLIIEGDAEISGLTAMYIEREGFDTNVINDGLAVIAAIKTIWQT